MRTPIAPLSRKEFNHIPDLWREMSPVTPLKECLKWAFMESNLGVSQVFSSLSCVNEFFVLAKESDFRKQSYKKEYEDNTFQKNVCEHP